MNKVILMGTVTKDPEVRYSQSATPIAIARYGLAVKRQFAKQGEVDVDFFNITSLGKAGEFAEKYLKKGMKVAVTGKLQNNNWEDQNKVKHYDINVLVEEQHFVESKAAFEARVSNSQSYNNQPYNNQSYGGQSTTPPSNNTDMGGFTPNIPMEEDDDLPF